MGALAVLSEAVGPDGRVVGLDLSECPAPSPS